MSVLKFGHPFEEHTANDEGNVDAHNADKELHALGFVDSVKKAHLLLSEI